MKKKRIEHKKEHSALRRFLESQEESHSHKSIPVDDTVRMRGTQKKVVRLYEPGNGLQRYKKK